MSISNMFSRVDPPDSADKMIYSWDYLFSTGPQLGPPKRFNRTQIFIFKSRFQSYKGIFDQSPEIFCSWICIWSSIIWFNMSHLWGVIEVVKGVSMRHWHPPLLIKITWSSWLESWWGSQWRWTRWWWWWWWKPGHHHQCFQLFFQGFLLQQFSRNPTHTLANVFNSILDARELLVFH